MLQSHLAMKMRVLVCAPLLCQLLQADVPGLQVIPVALHECGRPDQRCKLVCLLGRRQLQDVSHLIMQPASSLNPLSGLMLEMPM